VVTNAEICERIDSSDEWIRERSGIVERRWAAPDEGVVEMSVAAAGKALADAGITPEQVGAVVVATVSHLVQFPSAASDIGFRLGAVNASAFDISAACAGFCYGVGMASDMVRTGSVRGDSPYVLVIGVEKLSDLLDREDRSTAFIFADGAGAAVIGPADEPGIGPIIWGSDGSRLGVISQTSTWPQLRDNPDGVWPTIQMEGQSVFRWAVSSMAEAAQEALDAAGISADQLDAFIPHQANVRIIDAMARSLSLPPSVAIARDIVTTGNTSAASIPLAMARMLAEGEARSGDTALIIGFGAGLVHAAQVVTLP
jgi:3-oxoacyl-[acyl-carrier-protein] synthase-3